MLITVLVIVVIFLGLLSYYIFYIAPKLNPVNKAETFEGQKLFREAIFEYRKALDRKPEDFIVHYRLANLYLKLKEFDQAAIHLEEILRINKFNYEVDKLDVQKKLADQDAALAGQRGGLLWVVSKDDGTSQKRIELDTTPVWDGMAAAEGRLFLATTDGNVTCYTGR